MLHIVFVGPHCDPQANLGEPDSGGQCIYEHQLALALSAMPDMRVSIFCRQTFRRPNTTQINNSYVIHRIECGGTEFIPKEKIEAVIPEFVTKVEKFLADDTQDPLIVHGHYWDGGKASLEMKSRATERLPVVWTPHSLGALKRQRFTHEGDEFFYNFIPRLTWENYTTLIADRVIVSTENERQSLLNWYGVPDTKITIISPGVDFSTLVPVEQTTARQTLKLPLQGKILLCLGRMTPTKGYQYAIETLAKLKAKYSAPVYLVIVGGSGSHQTEEEIKYRDFLNAKVRELKLQESVIFKPAMAHDQIHTLFSSADVFLMPSDNEPFGLVTIEAMGIGKPVVASNKGGPAAMIVHNQTGVLVDFHNTQRAANYLIALFKDEDLYQKIALAAQHYAHRNYEWQRKAFLFAQVYHQISRQHEVEPFQTWIQDKYFLQKFFKTE